MIEYSSKSMNYPVRWNIKREPIYRIFNNIEYLENFFEKGEIMISCLNNFRNYPDEMKGDVDEGNGLIASISDKGDVRGVAYNSGINAFVMSTTTNLNERVIEDFEGKCAIKINNPEMFGVEIAKKLPFVSSGIEGLCNYAKSRSHFFKKEQKENKILQNIDFNDPDSIKSVQDITMGMELFLKLEKYKHQSEYRLIWFSNERINNSILIKCPEAIQFCQKIIL